jgi:hypothetical protein
LIAIRIVIASSRRLEFYGKGLQKNVKYYTACFFQVNSFNIA